MDIGDFLQLQRPFQGCGIIVPTAQIEEVMGIGINLRQILDLVCEPQHLLYIKGHLLQFPCNPLYGVIIHRATHLSRTEGIIPAIESAHAVAAAMKIAPTMKKDQIMIICLSGRGDKDMQQIAEYIINDGAITVMELNETDTELWKKAVKSFGGKTLASEIQTLSKFILKVA